VVHRMRCHREACATRYAVEQIRSHKSVPLYPKHQAKLVTADGTADFFQALWKWTIASSSLSGLARVRPRFLSIKSFEKVRFQLAGFAVGGNGLAVVDERAADASPSGPLRYAS